MSGPRLASVVLMVVLAPLAGATAQAQGGKVSAQIPDPVALARKAQQARLVTFAQGAATPATPGVSAPTLVSQVHPKYTPAAMKAGIQGRVVLFAVVGEDGQVKRSLVDSPLDPDLDQQALDALAQWRFRPATRDGRPVEVAVAVEMEFRTHR